MKHLNLSLCLWYAQNTFLHLPLTSAEVLYHLCKNYKCNNLVIYNGGNIQLTEWMSESQGNETCVQLIQSDSKVKFMFSIDFIICT